jgi:hypothetical protein
MIVGTETISEIVSNYELAIACDKCGAQTQKTIGWIRLHRDMKCPQCDAVIVLNTSRITGTIRSVERRLGDLQSQLTEHLPLRPRLARASPHYPPQLPRAATLPLCEPK